ncbi:MAG: proton-conducting transporter membrane subunit [Methanocellales archaeon]|nr:proton-conducting transporter membrane subunit [Methanocellales archaeon]
MTYSQIIFQSSMLLFAVSIIIPLICINAKKSLIRKLSLFTLIIACTGLLFFSFNVLVHETVNFHILLSGFTFNLSIDNLASFFIILISLIGLSVAIYSISYSEHFENEIKRNLLVSLTAFFILSMVFVVASHNLIAFLFFWELMSISSFMLVMFDYDKQETKKAGIFYFVMTQMSTIFLIFAFTLIYNHTNSLDYTPLQGLSAPLASLIFLSLTAGFAIKAGVIPFHKWLPYAHPASPSSISALMSGVMIKVAIYGFLRFLFLLPEQQLWWGILILIAGTVSALLGVIYALKEHDIKRLLAYHSIENIGIILLGVGLYMIFSFYQVRDLAMISIFAALFHTLNHALFKSLLFLSSGSVVYRMNTKNIEEMGGLIKKMPYTALLFLIGAISISALPPFNGFVSELMIFQVFLKFNVLSSPIIKIILILSLSLFALTSTLAAVCFVKAFGIVFLASPRSKEAESAKEVDSSMIIGPAIIAIFCIALGVFSYQIFEVIGQKVGINFSLPNLLILSMIAVFLGGLTYLIMKMVGNNKSRVTETWGCGINSQNGRMEYTASGFSQPVTTIFSSIYKPKLVNKKSFYDPDGVFFKEGEAKISLIKFFEEYLYMPVFRVISKVSSVLYSLQNRVELYPYILISFFAIISLLLYLGVIIR